MNARDNAEVARAALPTVAVRDLAGRTVLIAEDHEDTRDLVAFVLSQCGARVIVRPDADSAVAALRTLRCDVVVTDLLMPGSGVNVIRAARERGVPVLVLTGQTDAHIINRALEVGVDRIMLKPVEPALLYEAVVGLLSARAA